MITWQIRGKEYRYSEDSPILFEGKEIEALRIWIDDGYQRMYEEYITQGVECPFGLYRVEYTLEYGTDVKEACR